jgi:hypothetical protein
LVRARAAQANGQRRLLDATSWAALRLPSFQYGVGSTNPFYSSDLKRWHQRLGVDASAAIKTMSTELER